MDKLSETPQLIPVPNFVGNYDASGKTTYQPWDSVHNRSGGLYFMNGSNSTQTNTLGSPGLTGAWVSPYATGSTSAHTDQIFAPTNTGIENVQAIGGGSIAYSLHGGTGYPDSFTFSSSGGGSLNGVPCQVAGTILATSGVPVNAITYSVNQGCSSIPTIMVAAPSGSGLQFFGRIDSGSFYYASTSQNGALANELYVHLADGSDPSTHTFYATHRPYGILLRGVNNVNVNHIQFAHQLKSGILSFPYANSTLAGQYWTNENIAISYATCWNTGDTISDTLGWQGAPGVTASMEACVVLRASGDTNPHLVRGNSISDSRSGLIDMYYGRADDLHANFALSGLDGTQSDDGLTTSSYPVIQYSYGRSHNSTCIRYGLGGLSTTGTFLNQGGIVNNNECTDNANGNVHFGAIAGGRLAYNYIHDALGQGVQGGGFSTSDVDPTSYQAQLYDHNVIVNLGFSPTLAYYDGLDLNNGVEGPSHPYSSDIHIFNNTVFNTAASCLTMEMNIVATHVHDNVCAQASSFYPAGWMYPGNSTAINYAAGIYIRHASLSYSVPMDWHNNAWENQFLDEPDWIIYNPQLAVQATCSTLSNWPSEQNSAAPVDATSFCTAAPGFTNSAKSNFTLLPSSPLRATGTAGGDIGALPFGTPMFKVGPRL
ncbi:hypothetical protein [Granulicella sibirica]|uniref:hypothetical protein n=1 Tax=Granulicella sibirica TaxID=2479048 RepID=UPI001008CE0B|nr:hypothetical protein [Granulicella sibirica]